MTAKRVQFVIQGMNRDLSESKFSNKFAYDIKNLRLIADDSNDTLSLVNEKGTLATTIIWDETAPEGTPDTFIYGVPIGQEVIDNELILFTSKFSAGGYDNIYKFWFDDNGKLNGSYLFSGDLGFDSGHPIESIGIYESEHLKKVYWTDGLNQPRLINIAATPEEVATWTAESFDFVPNLKLDEEITIERNDIAMGVFPAGVIQYSFSYYNLYGQETNIFYTSPLYYTSFVDRGAPADATVSNSFKIHIEDFDKSFDYIRIYSTLRTTLNGVPQARRVVDIPIKNAEGTTLDFVDTGVEGDSIDPTLLLYIGGEDILAQTIEHKDNTLFLGNIGIRRPLISDEIKDTAKTISPEFIQGASLPINKFNGYYSYNIQLDKNSRQIKTFKSLEWYRLGIQAQYKNGKWSEPIFIKDVYNYNVKNYIDESTNTAKLVEASADIPISLINALVEAGYVRIRPVIVYPTLNDRECICQGVLTPTVYNVEDRWTSSPYAQSSWFFRPNSLHEYNDYPIETDPGAGQSLNVGDGYGAEFRHNFPIPGNTYPNAEIQCISNPPWNPYIGSLANDTTETQQWVSHFKECFYVDQSIFTMHSPDIEFDPEILNSANNQLKLRIIGFAPIKSSFSDIKITTDTPPHIMKLNGILTEALGFYKESISAINTANAWKNIISAPFWMDREYGFDPDEYGVHFGFVVYPWNRTGALNNCISPDESGYIASKLKNKVMSIFRYANTTVYLDGAWDAYFEDSPIYTGLSDIKFFNSNEMSMIKLKSQDVDNLPDIFYYGNVDKIVLSQAESGKVLTHMTLTDKSKGYDLVTVPQSILGPVNSFHTLYTGRYYPLSAVFDYSQDKHPTHCFAPVSMKYKSTPHAVMALNYTSDHAHRVLPNLNGINDAARSLPVNSGDNYPLREFWDKNRVTEAISQDTISMPEITEANTGNYLWIGELYNDSVVNRFGGDSDEAIANNKWEPCGEPFKIREMDEEEDLPVTMLWREGDTFYQRYDCLKTYPFTEGDENSIVDILSFMCETRINIDGRYDRSRGNITNFYATPETFNLLNKVYSQRNNFFEYRITDPNLLMETQYSNIITWGKTKVAGEIVDQWASVVLASSLELDGSLGKLNAIEKLNNNLIAFQDKGISQILYNENVQISSTSGVPIEIANSGKVQGRRYIASEVGCSNKWSIANSPNGIYFVDSIGKDIYLFNGELHNISDKFGFHSWVVQNFPDSSVWDPMNFKGCVTYYEPVNGDVFFILKDTCLAYSEPLGKFSSFYDYNGKPYLSVIKGRAIWWSPGAVLDYFSPFLHREGRYNEFFNYIKPYWITVITNPNEYADKIFNNVDFRADMFSKDSNTGKYNIYDKDHTFDTLTVWTEYQEGRSNLDDIKDYPSTLKKKFRIWRANIPRNTTNKFGDSMRNYSRDRIRNPWAYVKLGVQRNYSQDRKMILHDLIIDYFE